jgi:hypothetical protein
MSGELENASWNDQIDADSASGRLDFLFEEVDREASEGSLTEWPSPYADSL